MLRNGTAALKQRGPSFQRRRNSVAVSRHSSNNSKPFENLGQRAGSWRGRRASGRDVPEQMDLLALHRVRSRLVGQRTGVIIRSAAF
jgi:hypothetical protein